MSNDKPNQANKSDNTSNNEESLVKLKPNNFWALLSGLAGAAFFLGGYAGDMRCEWRASNANNSACSIIELQVQENKDEIARLEKSLIGKSGSDRSTTQNDIYVLRHDISKMEQLITQLECD